MMKSKSENKITFMNHVDDREFATKSFSVTNFDEKSPYNEVTMVVEDDDIPLDLTNPKWEFVLSYNGKQAGTYEGWVIEQNYTSYNGCYELECTTMELGP